MSIPLVGRVMWECNDDREFAFTFTPEQATITVEQSIDGEITRRQLDPAEEMTSEFLPAGSTTGASKFLGRRVNHLRGGLVLRVS